MKTIKHIFLIALLAVSALTANNERIPHVGAY